MSPVKTTAALAAAGLFSLSGVALAEGNTQSMNDRSDSYQASDNQEGHGGEYGAIDELPNKGSVTLSGTVTETDPDDNSFVLEDNTGETIDVHTTGNITLKEGDKVRVSGTMEDEAMGMGEQIVSARVQRMR